MTLKPENKLELGGLLLNIENSVEFIRSLLKTDSDKFECNDISNIKQIQQKLALIENEFFNRFFLITKK